MIAIEPFEDKTKGGFFFRHKRNSFSYTFAQLVSMRPWPAAKECKNVTDWCSMNLEGNWSTRRVLFRRARNFMIFRGKRRLLYYVRDIWQIDEPADAIMLKMKWC